MRAFLSVHRSEEGLDCRKEAFRLRKKLRAYHKHYQQRGNDCQHKIQHVHSLGTSLREYTYYAHYRMERRGYDKQSHQYQDDKACVADVFD